MVCAAPICDQFIPSIDEYPVNVLPLRTSFTQYGSATVLVCCAVVFPPVLFR
jgi:hypothetical protein